MSSNCWGVLVVAGAGLSLVACFAGAVSAATGLDDIAPVRCTRHVERTGPDLYEFDWPVNPGKWPLVDRQDRLRFPMGAYNGGRHPALFVSMAEWWQKSGFDFAHGLCDQINYTWSAQHSVDQFRELLLEAAKNAPGGIILHVGYIPSHCGMDVFAEFIRLVHSHPSVWGWDPMDEPFGVRGRGRQRALMYAHELKTIRAIDREHPVMLNVVTGTLLNGNLEVILQECSPEKPDILSTDNYPVQDASPRVSVRQATVWAQRVCRTAQRYGMTPYIIHGNFGPSDKPHMVRGARFPTLAELRSQLFQAILNGVQGYMIWNYAYWENLRYDDPVLHREMFRLNHEVHALTGPIFSALSLPAAAVGAEYPAQGVRREGDLQVRAAAYRDAIYVFVVNLAEAALRTPVRLSKVRISLPDLPRSYLRRLATEAEVLLEMAGTDRDGFSQSYFDRHGKWRRVPVTWDDNNAFIVDDLGPYAVHVYRVKTSVKRRDWDDERGMWVR